jgi:hypothetical protein
MASKLTNKKTGLKRDTIDKFYTCPTTAKNCVEHVTACMSIDPINDLIIEPSAGNGSFILEITTCCQNAIFYDIEPEHPLIIKADFLLLNCDTIVGLDTVKKIHVIGNPPFGRQSSLAIQFIKKSAEFADSISFILPKSFKKDSMQKHFPAKFHLVFQADMEANSFLQDGVKVDVPCVFQIWEKREQDRLIAAKLETDPSLFQFVKIDENPDISFRRVGVNAGIISCNKEEMQDKSVQSHYFIKFGPTINALDLIAKIKNIVYPTDNTVGPKSIGKQEIIREFNQLF